MDKKFAQRASWLMKYSDVIQMILFVTPPIASHIGYMARASQESMAVHVLSVNSRVVSVQFLTIRATTTAESDI